MSEVKNIYFFCTFNRGLKNWVEEEVIDREVAILKKLQEKGYHVTVFSMIGDKKEYDEEREIAQRIGVELVCVPKVKNIFSLIKYTFEVLKIRYNKSTPEELVLRTNQFTSAISAFLIGYKTNRKLVLRSGYCILSFAEKIKKSKKNIKIQFIKLLYKILYKNCDLAIFSSRADEEVVKTLINDDLNSIVIPNWVMSIEECEDNKIEKYYDILLVGRLVKQKNFKLVLESIATLDLRVAIVGTGPDYHELKALTQEINFKPEVKFISSLNHKELRLLMRTSKMLVSASFYEGNPKVIFEALSEGVEVIVNKLVTFDTNPPVSYFESNGVGDDLKNKILERISDHYLDDSALKEKRKLYIRNFHSLNHAVELEINKYKQL